MAQVAALRQAYVRLGFTNAAAHAITDDQQIDTVTELGLLTDDDVETLCKVIRRPGGTIPNPVADEPQLVPDPGIPVSMRAENNLKLAGYWVRHQRRISREATAVNITLDNVRKLRELRDLEKEYEAPDDVPKIDEKDWTKTLEGLSEHLRACPGETKIPLSYVIRKTREVLPELQDPSTNYVDVFDEMVARAPHFQVNNPEVENPTYVNDNHAVWQIVADWCRDNPCWTYVKPFQRRRDGRGAYFGLWNHYLGPNNIDNAATTAERRLETTTYDGEKRRWNFEKFVKIHKDQHTILDNLREHGYAGIDERSKVRHLLNGIKTDRLDSVKTRIMSDQVLRNSFDDCVTLFKDFITQSTSIMKNPTLEISALKTEGPTNPPNTSKPNSGKRPHETVVVEDRYFTKAEYQKLTPEQKSALYELRKGRKKPKKRGTTPIGKLERKVAALQSKIETLTADETGNAAKSRNEGEMSNRTNPALQRQTRQSA